MLMKKDALQLLLDTARMKTPFEVIKPECEPAHIYFTVNPLTGVLEKHYSETFPRKHVALSEKSFCDYVTTHVDVVERANPIVWVGRECVVAILDDESDRINNCTWRLPYTEKWHLLQSVLKASYDQISFARLLRLRLRGMVPASLMPIIQSLKLEQGKVQTGEVDRFKDTSSAEVRRSVSGVDKLPDSIQVSCPILQGDTSLEIECSVDVSLDTGKLSIVAFPDEVETALVTRFEDLAKSIADETGCSVFLGNPW